MVYCMLTISSILIIAGSGVLAGFLTGLVGLGGAFIVVPALYQILMAGGVDSHTAFTMSVATSIAFIFLSSSSATFSYTKKKMVDYRLLLLIGVSGIIGVWFGVKTILVTDDQLIRNSFGIFIWVMAVYMVLSKKYKWGHQHAGSKPNYTVLNQTILVAYGTVVGYLVAIFGIGGGGIIAPAIALLFKSDMKRAIATAVATTSLIAVYGVATYVFHGSEDSAVSYGLGWVYLPALLLLVPSAFLITPLGVKVATKLSQATLTSIVAVSMFFIGARFIFL